MRIGILGGSFNPPHLGHLAIARAAIANAGLDKVLLIPASQPPHKRVSGGVSGETRLAMTGLLAREDPRLAVDGLELERDGPSYTVDTVEFLAASRPSDSFRLILGSDMAMSFAKWRRAPRVLDLAPPLVAERPDAPLPADSAAAFPGLPPGYAEALQAGRFPMPPVDISSTMIRKAVARGADDAELAAMLPASVIMFIRERNLYRDSDGGCDLP